MVGKCPMAGSYMDMYIISCTDINRMLTVAIHVVHCTMYVFM